LTKQKKIGLFFGSFNPVHIGHLAIAGHMLEFTDLDEVWMVVSPHNPLKKKETLLSDTHRLRLVREAIGENTSIKASNIEFKLPQPNYTIDTLAYLREKYPAHKFVLIMGTDNLQSLHKWKNYEQLLKDYSIYAYKRPGFDSGTLAAHPSVKITDAPLMEISSSFIRQAIKDKKDVRYLLASGVWQYIKEMHFYEK
jgi:nicotinate-nucleotide adenylyltransferase